MFAFNGAMMSIAVRCGGGYVVGCVVTQINCQQGIEQ